MTLTLPLVDHVYTLTSPEDAERLAAALDEDGVEVYVCGCEVAFQGHAGAYMAASAAILRLDLREVLHSIRQVG